MNKLRCLVSMNLFQDMYDWAGKFRTVDIGKGNLFCLYHHLDSFVSDICARLKRENYLIGVPKAQRLEKMADYYGDFNAAHPFREGNGRSLRVFTEILGKVNGLDFDKATEQELLHANVQSFNLNNEGLVKIFQSISTSNSYFRTDTELQDYLSPSCGYKDGVTN